MNHFQNVIAAAVIAVAVLVGVFLLGQKVDHRMKDMAVDACLKTGVYTSQVGNQTGKNSSQEPMKDWYNFCMKEKGYAK